MHRFWNRMCLFSLCLYVTIVLNLPYISVTMNIYILVVLISQERSNATAILARHV